MDTNLPAPAEAGSQDSVASQVTTQAAEQSEFRRSDKNPEHPLAEKPAGVEQEAIEQETASDQPEKQEEQLQDDEGKKTWKEKRKERNRDRWQEFKAAKDYTIKSLQGEIERLKSRPAPDLSNIIDPDEIIAEKTAWKIQQSSVSEKEQALEAERETLAREQQQELARTWFDVLEKTRSLIPDFDAKFTEDTPIHERAVPYIIESEKAGDIAYHLGKYKDEAKELYDLFATAPAKALKELGRLEERLSTPKAKTVSTAPKPAPTLRGGSNPLAFDAKSASVGDMQAQLRKSGVIR